MADSFAALVGEKTASVLAAQGIVTPTDIQRRVIPELLAGRDVVAESPTGSGKTLAYLLPALARVDMESRAVQAVALAPTRELAAQVARVAQGISDCGAALLIGGASIQRQLEALKAKPRVVVGSAGRMLELIEMKKLSVHHARIIVLDEADKLLDADNRERVVALIRKTLRDRQLCAVSASITKQAEEAARALMNDPVVIRENARQTLPGNLTHIVIPSARREKAIKARKYLNGLGAYRALVFVNNPYHVRNTAEKLRFHGVNCEAVYGGMPDTLRRLAVSRFREGAAQALVASDIAARGLDMPNVTHVVNLDAPERVADYLHRAGRAGREGGAALVVTFAEPREMGFIAEYEKAFGITIEKG